jgi:hypothetical protein
MSSSNNILQCFAKTNMFTIIIWFWYLFRKPTKKIILSCWLGNIKEWKTNTLRNAEVEVVEKFLLDILIINNEK